MKFSKFREEILKNNISQSYIFEGDIKFLNLISNFFISRALNPEENSRYESEIENGTHPDVLIVESEKNHISISKIRNIIEYVQQKPIYSKYKLVMIENAQFLGIEASNALLKTLEESFEYVIICLLVDNRFRLLNTIQSRCIFVTDDNYTEKVNYSDYSELLNIVEMALKSDLMCIYSQKNKEYLLSLKEDEEFLNILYKFFKDFYLYLNTKSSNFDKSVLKIFERYANYSISKVYDVLETIDIVKVNLKNNVNFQLSIEKIFIEILKKEK